MKVKEIQIIEEYRNALDENKKMVVLLAMTACPPCRKLAPIFTEVSELPQFDKVPFYKVYLDDVPEVNDFYGVGSVPTVLVIANGNVTERVIGYMSKEKLVEFLEKSI